MTVEITDRNDFQQDIKVSCANGDIIRVFITEINNEVQLKVTCIETDINVLPKYNNQILINFVDIYKK
jgi:hypothetical protein